MNGPRPRPTDEQLMAFLEGELDREERAAVLDALERDPALAKDIRSAAIGMTAVEALPPSGAEAPVPRAGPRRISPWWAVAAAAASLVVALPFTWWLAASRPARSAPVAVAGLPPVVSEPGFVLVLHGRWPDAASIGAEETSRRAGEYWAWASSLVRDSVLMAAGDLRWEPGRRLAPGGTAMAVTPAVLESPDFVVGMFALRVGSYDDAMAIARACPHLQYGGSISVRRVARGFVTTQGSVSLTGGE